LEIAHLETTGWPAAQSRQQTRQSMTSAEMSGRCRAAVKLNYHIQYFTRTVLHTCCIAYTGVLLMSAQPAIVCLLTNYLESVTHYFVIRRELKTVTFPVVL